MWPFTNLYQRISDLEKKVELMAADIDAAKNLYKNDGPALAVDAAKITELEGK
jgi:hypothetical protein